MDNEERTLTDADIEKIAVCLEERLLGHFYVNLGKGVWSILWKASVFVMLALAAFGHFKGGTH